MAELSNADHVQYWLETAADDLVTAQVLWKQGHYQWMGFLCHLVIEKSLKAAVARTMMPPKMHDLDRLAELSGLDSLMNDEQKKVIDMLLPLHIEASYPPYNREQRRILNREYCEMMLAQTLELAQWIKARL